MAARVPSGAPALPAGNSPRQACSKRHGYSRVSATSPMLTAGDVGVGIAAAARSIAANLPV